MSATTPPKQRLPITCARYEALPGSKRCRHYHPNGACGLPDEFMCVEWLKANGHPAPASSAPPSTRAELGALRTITDADIASFKALGVEVRLESADLGDVWLVPTYTSAERLELSVEHAALLAAVCAAFPGARVTSFSRPARRVPA